MARPRPVPPPVTRACRVMAPTLPAHGSRLERVVGRACRDQVVGRACRDPGAGRVAFVRYGGLLVAVGDERRGVVTVVVGCGASAGRLLGRCLLGVLAWVAVSGSCGR